MKLSRNKIANLLKIRNQSRKNIMKRRHTVGAPLEHGNRHAHAKPQLKEGDGIWISKKSKTAHLKHKPLNLRFKTLKGGMWRGRGGMLSKQDNDILLYLKNKLYPGYENIDEIREDLLNKKESPILLKTARKIVY